MSASSYVGKQVRTSMQAQRLSQQEVAARMGVTQAAISLKLNGHRPWTLEELFSIAAILNVDPWGLLPPNREAART